MVDFKTPVAILQEYGVSVGLLPTYELVVDGNGTHNPCFQYRVYLGEMFADGTGTSKMRAKHSAAELMIDILQYSNKANTKELGSCAKLLKCPQQNVIPFNAVGELKEYCDKKQCPEAVYTLTYEDGPPHAKVFTIKCSVSHLVELGTAKTKQQAKQRASHNMLIKLTALRGEKCNAICKIVPDSTPKSAKAVQPNNDAEAEAQYLALSKRKDHPKNSAYISDFPKSILNLMGKSATLTNIVNSKMKFENIKDKVGVLSAIANDLGVDISTESSFSDDLGVVFMKLSVKPPIVCFGKGCQDAAEKVLHLFLSYFV